MDQLIWVKRDQLSIPPELTARMARAVRLLAAGCSLATEQEHGLAVKADFSRTILQACPQR
jgi:hypothetical protein